MEISEGNEKIYSENLNSTYYQFSMDRLKKTRELVGAVKGKMLDVGCGDGLFTALFKRKDREIFGLDIVEKNVLLAQEKGIKAKKCDLNCEKFPFGDKLFDLVLCSEVIEHIYDTEKFTRELNRVLKDEGKLVISVPNIACWYNRGVLVMGQLPYYIESGSTIAFGSPLGEDVTGHVKAFTKKSLIELLEFSGFKIDKVTGSKINLTPHCTKKRHFAGNGIFKVLEGLFCTVPSLASNIIIKASKK
ncbi:MAG: class I SAM-dependent methyltransferase [Candidatus Diapherotrites archaeon]